MTQGTPFQESTTLPDPLVPLASSSVKLETVGGKGANLVRLQASGFPVPEGFVIPTSAYHNFVKANGLAQTIQTALTDLEADSLAAVEAASAFIRDRFSASVIPAALVVALEKGWRSLGAGPVAVRSSATAEDLPDLSFAGQQDTYLNIVEFNAYLRAVVNCWGSLWTARAISYRARNAIPTEHLSLAVVIQKMVQPEASGVLFTANPVSGRRTETVIEATFGLGEALVSGQVEPDRYTVDLTSRRILTRSIGAKAISTQGIAEGGIITKVLDGSKRQAIPDDVILQLADIGNRVGAEFNAPQDVEWAWAEDRIYLLQSRPITSLFPLPPGMEEQPLKVMMAFSVFQGIFDPLTPLGQDAIMVVPIGIGNVLGYDQDFNKIRTIFRVAGERIWIDFTTVLRNSIGQEIVPRIAGALDPGVSQTFHELVKDSRLAPKHPGIRIGTLRHLITFLLPTLKRILQIWRNPEGERLRSVKILDDLIAQATTNLAPTGNLWTDFKGSIRLIKEEPAIFTRVIFPHGITLVASAMIPFFLFLERLSRKAAQELNKPELKQIYLEIARGMPHNVTTEMDLALWQAAQSLRADQASEDLFKEISADQLTSLYLKHELPGIAQRNIESFMNQYGMRGPGEIDIGRPRWREQPEPIMQTLQSYLRIEDRSQAPDVIFSRGSEAAEIAAKRLENAVGSMRSGWINRRLIQWAIPHYRALAGLRETPKFFIIRLMGLLREGFLRSGQSMVAAGLLEQPDDLFYLSLRELEEMADREAIPPETKARIQDRRGTYLREKRRKQIPRVLLSDGTSYYEGKHPSATEGSQIVGDPVSPGLVEGLVHIVLNPNTTQLTPGEILVCPGTDPAWTPLFLAAGGLVMETGGMMTHGSVVAREYGIPAVVGVHQATTRFHNGQRIRVDGTLGRIEILANPGTETEPDRRG